jgi:hypothetical protein
LDQAVEAQTLAAEKEQAQLREEARQREIADHQQQIREKNRGREVEMEDSGCSISEDEQKNREREVEKEDSGCSISEEEQLPEEGKSSKGAEESVSLAAEGNESVSSDSLNDEELDDIKTGDISSLEDSSLEEENLSPPPAAVNLDEESSEISASSEEESSEVVPQLVVPRVKSSDRNRTQRKSLKSPRKARGDIPPPPGVVLPYSQLRGGYRGEEEEEVDQENLEIYLSDEEFGKVMGLTRAKFYQLPSWRRAQIKKEKNL